jgi:putative PIG3 family NAD(P)H quinone oxidoreductase
MKAVICRSQDSFDWGEVPEPTRRDGEVIVSVRATAVNRADLLQAAGKYPPPPGESEILGLEASGVVDETGEAVCFLLPGGGYAEKVAVPRALLMPVPQALSFEEAAAIPEAWLTAFLNLVMEAGLADKESVLLHAAASGVGTAGIQLAKKYGCRVAVTARSAEKLRVLSAMGADLGLDTSDGQFAGGIEGEWGKDAVSVILDPVGGSFFPQNVQVLARGGRLIQIATMGGPKSEIDLRALMAKRLRIIGSTLRNRSLAEKSEITRRFLAEVLPGFQSGALKPVIHAVLPITQVAEAHDILTGNENIGKVVLTVPV